MQNIISLFSGQCSFNLLQVLVIILATTWQILIVPQTLHSDMKNVKRLMYAMCVLWRGFAESRFHPHQYIFDFVFFNILCQN